MRTVGFFGPNACPGGTGARGRLSRGSRATLLFVLIMVSALVLPACSTDSGSGAAYPLTLTDSLGRSVHLAGIPERIVTAHPTATELLCAAGGMPVGCDSTSKYPSEVQGLPTIGSAFYLSVESIPGLRPDLIVIEAVTQARYLGALESVGAPVMAVKAASMEDIAGSLALLGQAIDHREDAAAAVADIRARVEDARAASTSSASILVLVADEQRKIYAAREDSYPGTVAGLLGLDNLAADLPGSGPYAGFAELTGEVMAGLDPDVILTITPAPQPAPRLSALLPSLPVYKDKAAVREGRVAELDPSLYLQAQGPRIASAVEGLLEIMRGYE